MLRYPLVTLILLLLAASCAPVPAVSPTAAPSATNATLPRPPTALPTDTLLPRTPTALPTDTTLPRTPTALPTDTTSPRPPTALPTETLLPRTPTPRSTDTPLPTPTLRATPTIFPRGVLDPDITVDIYEPESAWIGTTLLADNHNLDRPRIIEVNMLGEIVWEYRLPENLKQFTNPGFDVEPLPNSNILFVLPRSGVYEINRYGKVVWSYLDRQVSHDADRLPNGNTLVAFGAMDTPNDAQVKEVNLKGEMVWRWYARDHFAKPPFKDIFNEGWTHTNAVLRLANGNTLVSLRNFNLIAEVDPSGSVVRTHGEGLVHYQHDPVVLPNGNLLLADHSEPQRAIELDAQTGQIVWQFVVPRQLVRDANRLPNGNTLITGSTAIIEVTPRGRIVWRFGLKMVLEKNDAPGRGFYKAERISAPR